MATTFNNNKLFCSCCGGELTLDFPITVDKMTEKIDVFNSLHNDCKQTYTSPKVDANLEAREKGMWWIANGSTGMSSKTMWNCLMGNKGYPINHPYDPDDFSRCYKLLECVPEWKKDINKLKPLSKQWSNLVDNWEKLTQMYEQNEKQDWKNSKIIGMYEFMQTLIN